MARKGLLSIAWDTSGRDQQRTQRDQQRIQEKRQFTHAHTIGSSALALQSAVRGVHLTRSESLGLAFSVYQEIRKVQESPCLERHGFAASCVTFGAEPGGMKRLTIASTRPRSKSQG